MDSMVHLALREANNCFSTQIKTYSQYLSPASRFLGDLFSETSLDSMAEVSKADLIDISASAMQGWNPRSLMTSLITASHSLPTPLKSYNALTATTSLPQYFQNSSSE